MLFGDADIKVAIRKTLREFDQPRALAHRRRDADDQRILLGGAAQPVAENLRVAERTDGFIDRKCPSTGIELGDAVIFDWVGPGRSDALALGKMGEGGYGKEGAGYGRLWGGRVR